MVAVLKVLWAAWTRVAHRIANFQARLLLSIFYFVVLAPFAVAVKLFSDPLQLRPALVAAWLQRERHEGEPLVLARRQF